MPWLFARIYSAAAALFDDARVFRGRTKHSSRDSGVLNTRWDFTFVNAMMKLFRRWLARAVVFLFRDIAIVIDDAKMCTHAPNFFHIAETHSFTLIRNESYSTAASIKILIIDLVGDTRATCARGKLRIRVSMK